MNFLKYYLNDKDVLLSISHNTENEKEINESENKKTENIQKEPLLGKRKFEDLCPIKMNNEEEFEFKKPIFLKEKWFDNLCLCDNCLKTCNELEIKNIYECKDENVNF